MHARRFVRWFWTELLSVAIAGALGIALFELLWLAVSREPDAPRSFQLFAGVAMCTWLHPRLVKRPVRLGLA